MNLRVLALVLALIALVLSCLLLVYGTLGFAREHGWMAAIALDIGAFAANAVYSSVCAAIHWHLHNSRCHGAHIQMLKAKGLL